MHTKVPKFSKKGLFLLSESIFLKSRGIVTRLWKILALLNVSASDKLVTTSRRAILTNI